MEINGGNRLGASVLTISTSRPFDGLALLSVNTSGRVFRA